MICRRAGRFAMRGNKTLIWTAESRIHINGRSPAANSTRTLRRRCCNNKSEQLSLCALASRDTHPTRQDISSILQLQSLATHQSPPMEQATVSISPQPHTPTQPSDHHLWQRTSKHLSRVTPTPSAGCDRVCGRTTPAAASSHPH